MAGIIDLSKKVEIVLAKRNLHNIQAQTGFAIDISGSMGGLYANGTVQSVTERVLAVALRFDDNGELDVWTFSNGATKRESATASNYQGYVEREILRKRKNGDFCGTEYAPVIEDVKEEYFGRKKGLMGLFGAKKEAKPSILMFVTDGDNSDKADTDALLRATANLPIYYQFIGIGSERFSFLEKVADAYPNTGFVKIADIARISDDDLYEQLITDELADWLKNYASK